MSDAQYEALNKWLDDVYRLLAVGDAPDTEVGAGGKRVDRGGHPFNLEVVRALLVAQAEQIAANADAIDRLTDLVDAHSVSTADVRVALPAASAAEPRPGLGRRLTAFARDPQHSPVASLTCRELEIVSLIEQGLANKEIARRLNIQVATVKNHVHNILEKLGVRRRGQAAATVRQHRALRIDPT